jgi:hypothetical protein
MIWCRSLADRDADGKMDINEFSIACKLINLKLRGLEIPKVLPPSLLVMPAGTPPTMMSPGCKYKYITWFFFFTCVVHSCKVKNK